MCSVCKQLKKATTRNFYKQKGQKDGLQSKCKKCAKEYYHDYWYQQRSRAIDKQSEIIDLYYNKGLDEKEIGKKLGIPGSIAWTVISKERTRRKRNKEEK